MKKILASTVAASVLILAGQQIASAQFGNLLGSVKTATNALAPAQSGGGMKANAQLLATYMNLGTYHLVIAVARMELAVGHADNAKALNAQAELIKQEGSAATADDYTKTYAMVDQSNINRDELAKVPEAKGRAELTQSSLHLGIGGLEDRKAETLAQALASATPSTQDAMDGSIISAINVARVAMNVLPGHVDKTVTWTGYLNDYFSSHKIAPPSEDEKKKVAAQDLPPDDANALFASQ